MSDLPPAGLYRTTLAHPLAPREIPANTLVYRGDGDDGPFVVRPYHNENNRWFWQAPTTPLDDPDWARTLIPLPVEGFYTLPEAIDLEGGGRWLESAIVQLGYDGEGHGILFIAERRSNLEENALFFSDRGLRIEDDLLRRLRWSPILPVSDSPDGPMRH
ncbi:MAG: hypothetical protein GXP55_17440 [Deltaproteobacteria bacterium]|nr:hypothetical protein [Deltaproteobacteria bacterium]